MDIVRFGLTYSQWENLHNNIITIAIEVIILSFRKQRSMMGIFSMFDSESVFALIKILSKLFNLG